MSSHIPGSDLYAAPEELTQVAAASESQPSINGISNSSTVPIINATISSVEHQQYHQHSASAQTSTAATSEQPQPVGISATELLGSSQSAVIPQTSTANHRANMNAPRVEIKLFIGRLPKQMTEGELTPLFSQYGEVLETVIIRDKASGQHKGSAFIKMGSLTEADKAIRMLHNIKVVDNQLGPIQVKYANGEAERLGLPVENANPGVDIGKLFVGSLPRGVNEQQVRDIFEQYGSIEEIVLMKDAGTGQTKGCAFVKFSYKENAINAIKNLNGQHHCPGCPRALEVKFAESRRSGPSAHLSTPGHPHMGAAAPHPHPYGMPTGAAPHRAPLVATPSNLNPRSAGGWTEYFTADGRPYYHNETTKTTQWTKPPEFDRIIPPPTPSAPSGSTDVAGPPGANVFVFHIPNEWTQNEVIQNFSPFGRVISCYIATDRTTGRNKGYGFVSFDSIEAAANAVLGMNGFLVGSKRLKVSIKTGEEAYVAHLLSPQAQAAAIQAGQMGAPSPMHQRGQLGGPGVTGSVYSAYGSSAATGVTQGAVTAATGYGPSAGTSYAANYRTAPY